jgi:hypothetical protein
LQQMHLCSLLRKLFDEAPPSSSLCEISRRELHNTLRRSGDVDF